MSVAAQPRAHEPGPLSLSITGISKRFPGVQALENVHLTARAGEVTALIGENGAGKSTIVKILTGIYTPDAGTIEIEGRAQRFETPVEAWNAGITAIHQEAVMFDELSVAENIYLGHEMMRGGTPLIAWREIERRTAALLTRLNIDIAPATKLKTLSVAQRHIVGIAKALSHDARIVIMDEPTASLSQREIDYLFEIVRQLKADGKAIIFISHKFEEIFTIADRYTVLRDGRFIGEGQVNEITRGALVQMMVGRELADVFPKVEVPIGETILSVEHLSHETEFDDISFALHRGEILGFYGLVGAGRSEVMQAIFGITRPKSGRVTLDGAPLRISEPADAIAAGLAYVPEDRQAQGAILPLTIRENVTLPLIDRLSKFTVLRPAHEYEVTRAMGVRLSIRATHWDQRVEQLSGGNQQKVVIAKWLSTRPKVIILDEPTKGIDIASKAAVHAFMGALVRDGLAVILVTSELEEVRGMADRVVVMHEGRIRRIFDRAEATAEAIVTEATGGA